MNCAACRSQICQVRQRDELPQGCPMLEEGGIEKDIAAYGEEENCSSKPKPGAAGLDL